MRKHPSPINLNTPPKGHEPHSKKYFPPTLCQGCHKPYQGSECPLCTVSRLDA
jgi:hypothetical protein